MLPRKTSLAILTVAMMLGLLARAKVLKWVDLRPATAFEPRPEAPAPNRC